MTWTIQNKLVLITGGTSGIGNATARELARRGAHVTITSRTPASAETAAADITTATGQPVAGYGLDLSSLGAIRDFTTRFTTDHDQLDVLINNAGTMTRTRRPTTDGYEWTFAVNHLGPFLLTNLLLDLLGAPDESRVITVSSENYRSVKNGLNFDDLQMVDRFNPSKAYAASKLASILFTTELDRRYHDTGITARALHPGVVATNFGRGNDSPRWMGPMMTILKPVLRTPEKGAATSVFLATTDTATLEQGLYWSNQQPKQPSPTALDSDAAKQLWTISEQLVDLPT